LVETEHILEMTEYLWAKGWYFCGGKMNCGIPAANKKFGKVQPFALFASY
jgi:hypothetical protein